MLLMEEGHKPKGKGDWENTCQMKKGKMIAHFSWEQKREARQGSQEQGKARACWSQRKKGTAEPTS